MNWHSGTIIVVQYINSAYASVDTWESVTALIILPNVFLTRLHGKRAMGSTLRCFMAKTCNDSSMDDSYASPKHCTMIYCSTMSVGPIDIKAWWTGCIKTLNKKWKKAATIRTKWRGLSRVVLEVSALLWRHWHLPFHLTWLHQIHCDFLCCTHIIQLPATETEWNQAKLALAPWEWRHPGLQCLPVITQRQGKLCIISTHTHTHSCVCAISHICL